MIYFKQRHPKNDYFFFFKTTKRRLVTEIKAKPVDYWQPRKNRQALAKQRVLYFKEKKYFPVKKIGYFRASERKRKPKKKIIFFFLSFFFLVWLHIKMLRKKLLFKIYNKVGSFLDYNFVILFLFF